MKIMYVDCETTGLDPELNGIHQLSGIIEKDGVEIETFDFSIAPLITDVVEKAALEVSGVTAEQLGDYPNAHLVKGEFCKMLATHVDKFNKYDKFHFVAYNAPFDSNFVRKWFEKQRDQYFGSWFWTPPIDVMTLAGALLMDKRHELPNFKLATVADYLKIEMQLDKLHDALYDVRLAREIFKRIGIMQSILPPTTTQPAGV